ncbi:uncharacterized protein LOC134275243 [Saccostrea cucullata]|uniref:uncharacterized protein LOC134275243 n=1 Tax=Saccostrea cuccullata TaxID=36930 RepID=UPI002ED4DC63
MPVCSCKSHSDNSAAVYKISSKKYKKCVIQALIENKVLSDKSTYLCTTCASECLKTITDKPVVKAVEEVVKLIEEKKLSTRDKKRLLRALLQDEKMSIEDDSKHLSSKYKDTQYLSSLDTKKWLLDRNHMVIQFLSVISGRKIQDLTEKQTAAFIFAVEQIYSLVTSNLILPLTFSKNLLSYYFSGSRSICTMNSIASPGGSYQSIVSWIAQQGGDPITISGVEDVLTFFDNNQILTRRWRVNYDNKTILSAITTVVHLFPHNLSYLQQNPHLSPRQWLYPKNLSSQISNFSKYLDKFGNIFRELRLQFVESRLEKVYKSHTDGLTGPTDTIEEGVRGRKRKRGEDLPNTTSRVQEDPYSFVEHNHPGKPTIIMGNPVAKNPCSYEAVKEVLAAIKAETTGETRKWTIVGCDGLPYLIGNKVIEQEQDLQDILLVPGLGHFEINMTKAIIKLVWEIFGEDLAKMLGYRTAKALSACHDASDHHKAFQFVEILLYGTGDELLIPYVRDCISSGDSPSALGYFRWCSSVKDCNYRFVQEIVFTYILALYMFRVGVRRNNSQVMMAGRIKFAPLFFGLNKFNYQQIEVLDSIMRLSAPSEVLHFINENESMTQSGHHSKGEGGDFILESKNKETKRWLPPGAPKFIHWNQACRNLDKLEKVNYLQLIIYFILIY